MTRTRRSFTDEFKREAVKLVKQPGAMVTHIARDFGIEASVLRRWVNQEREGVLDMRPSRPIRSEAAMEKNMEAGVLISGGRIPRLLDDHLRSLVDMKLVSPV